MMKIRSLFFTFGMALVFAPQTALLAKEGSVSKVDDSRVIQQRRIELAGAPFLNANLTVDERVQDLAKRMSLDEQITYLAGTGFKSGIKIGETQPLTAYGLPAFKMTDATLGSKLTKDAILFPAYIGLAASFNTQLSNDYGRAVAEQSRADGYRILLGPGINMYRVPHNGRNFEYLGEDPYLTSRLVVAYIKAVQQAGVLATVKHFVANNSDYYRQNSNSVIDERVLRELYFPAFKAAIQEADVKAVMMAYNLINGKWAGEHPWLIQDILRKEWAFTGMVMSDWWSVFNAKETILSGLDLEMPKADMFKAENIKKLLTEKSLTPDDIKQHVINILTPIFAMGLADDINQTSPSLRNNWAEHAEIAKQLGRESLVLLKNDGVLPLDRNKVKHIAVIGNNALETIASGEGAAGFDPGKDFVTYFAAIKNSAGKHIKVEHYQQPNAAVAKADVAVVFVNVTESESRDRNFKLPPEQQQLIEKTAALNNDVVVVVSSGGAVEMPSWQNKARGVFYAWYPGTWGATAIGEAIFGDFSPSGKLPISIEQREEDSHYWGNYIEGPKALPFAEKQWLSKKKGVHHHDIHYREGVLMGYRWYDAKPVEPLYPFGFGLSYTRFSLSKAKLSSNSISADEQIEISVTVSNIGQRSGAEVVQLYVHDVTSSVLRPIKELKAFSKVFVEAGESKQVSLTIDRKALQFWHPETKAWTVEAGEFELLLGTSSQQSSSIGRISYQ
ncbi:MAG: glycoside hydrolase family 3 C-terminal domain-containing protein [Colwellia sp.]|nr:glycoside hydrolase family 3 C-terminal domain-containing protein [Colwellia sp.]MCW8863498.1 glycoside hydrolase family 3 C-terminal domain-containing protein [Colwellia sp.]MCW9079932.1 glycoside hydrolase family 3 C-terminal domain-containing protein [Colwellia sp.]